MYVRNKAVFLDRDGTLIEDVGILTAPGDIRIFPDTITALRKLGREYYNGIGRSGHKSDLVTPSVAGK